jgi:hypothetical protein
MFKQLFIILTDADTLLLQFKSRKPIRHDMATLNLFQVLTNNSADFSMEFIKLRGFTDNSIPFIGTFRWNHEEGELHWKKIMNRASAGNPGMPLFLRADNFPSSLSLHDIFYD